MKDSSHSFTVSADSILQVVETEASVCRAFDPANPPGPMPPVKRFRAVWDTGATSTIITQRVVDDCNLKATGMANVYTTNGICRLETYLICIFLPNRIGFPNLIVTKGNPGTTDVLVGMDIISKGDFALTHGSGKTTFSFRYPSMTTIDFLREESK